MPYTYMVQCADGSYYTGWTTDLENRIKKHNQGNGARYTRYRRPVELVYWEYQPTRSAALRREYILRRLKRAEKKKIVTAFRKTDTGKQQKKRS